MKLIAKSDYTYNGRALKAGDVFEGGEKTELLVTLGKAAHIAEGSALDVPRTKRKYTRRDMTASA